MLGLPAMTLPTVQPAADKAAAQAEQDKKVAELEKRLAEEHEKLLLANLKNQQESATAARVEVSIRELQDKLRRDRRDAESEESRRGMELKVQELEARLAQERETWVTTLKNQMESREAQDKDVESHFAMRLQEMERRWLEEKAGWQKAMLAKEDEVRTLRNLAEKLKGADGELARTTFEKRQIEERIGELLKERAELAGQAHNAVEREKEAMQLRADLALSRQQYTMLQDRLERDLQAVRISAREREERILADQERLQRDLSTLSERMRGEHEADLRRVRMDAETDAAKHKESAERAAAEAQKLRSVCGALERQAAAGRAQLEELRRAASEWERAQERYKAEFVVLQRKWVDREKEVRSEVAAQSLQMLEVEKGKIKMQAQEELNARAARMAEQLKRENESELAKALADLRAEVGREYLGKSQDSERVWDSARAAMQAEIERLHSVLPQKESEWSQKFLAQERELMLLRSQQEDLPARLAKAEAQRDEAAARVSDLGQAHEQEKIGLERLIAAQSVQLRSLEDSMDRLRAAGSRANDMAEGLLAGKDKIEADKAQLEVEMAHMQQEIAKLKEGSGGLG
jgi:hypothetical protein